MTIMALPHWLLSIGKGSQIAGIGRRPGETVRLPSDLGLLPPALGRFMSGIGALDGIAPEDWKQPGPTMCASTRPISKHDTNAGSTSLPVTQVLLRVYLLWDPMDRRKSPHAACCQPTADACCLPYIQAGRLVHRW